MSEPSVGIAITAKNKTQAGIKSAERDLAGLTKRTARSSATSVGASQRATTDWGRSMVRTFSQVERATSGVFSGRGGIIGKMTAARSAASLLGSGMGAAAEGAGLLEAGIVGVGTAATSTAAVVVGLAIGMTKLADSWGKGATQLGNMASIIGVSTKGLQEFAGAAERAGVDKNTAMGALGGLSETLNDASYGRNPAALALLAKLGIGVQRNQDGTVNVEAMLPALADAMQRQNSSGRRTIARNLGINSALIPVLAQGGAALRGDMNDVGKVGAVVSDDDVALGRQITHRDVAGMQRLEKIKLLGQRANASIVKNAGDMLIDAYEAVTKPSGTSSSPPRAPAAGGSGAPAAGGAAAAVNGQAIQLSAQEITDLKKGFATEWGGRSAAQGHGIIDTILNRRASGHWGSSVADVLNARYQFSDVNGPVAWKHGWRSVDGIPASRVSKAASAFVDDWLKQRALGAESSVGDNLNYANPYFSSRRARKWIDPLDGPVLGSGTNIHKHGTVPELERYRPGAFGVGTPEIPVKVEVTVTSDRPATAAVTAGSRPKVSQAFGRAH